MGTKKASKMGCHCHFQQQILRRISEMPFYLSTSDLFVAHNLIDCVRSIVRFRICNAVKSTAALQLLKVETLLPWLNSLGSH